MSRAAGQLSARQAVLGSLAVLAAAAGVVAALGLLLSPGERTQPLAAPAEPAAEQPCLPAVSPPAAARSDDLIECPDTYDQQTVRYRGEAVRAVLRRGDRAWVHLNDDLYALELGPAYTHRTSVGGNSGIPVSIPVEVADQITHVGDARHHGDVLDVIGTYYRADPDDDGGPAIQARTALIDEPGRPVDHPVSRARIVTAVALAVLAMAAAAAAHLREPSTPPALR